VIDDDGLSDDGLSLLSALTDSTYLSTERSSAARSGMVARRCSGEGSSTPVVLERSTTVGWRRQVAMRVTALCTTAPIASDPRRFSR
jgi:hypothetical protein